MAEEFAIEIISQSSNKVRITELEDQVALLKSRIDAFESGKKPHEGWAYSAPMITSAEFEEMGYEDDLPEAFEYVVEKFKQTASDLRWGGCEQFRLGDNTYDGVLKFHSKLMPHFREIADGLACLRDRDELEYFDVVNVALPKQVIVMFKKALRGKKLKVGGIQLEGNCFDSIDDSGVAFAVDMLRECDEVRSFHFESNRIRWKHILDKLVDAINNTPSLRVVRLMGCIHIRDEGIAYDTLCSILEANKELEYVHFQTMKFEFPDDSTRLIKVLRRRPKLKYLDLCNNSSTSGYGYGLAPAEWRNSTDVDDYVRLFEIIAPKNPDLQIRIGNFNAWRIFSSPGKEPYNFPF